MTPELVWGTYHSASTPLIIDLTENNSFDMRPGPVMWETISAGGFARPIQTGSGKTELKGNLKLLLRGSQAAALAAWIDAGGAAAPSSMTIDHVLQMEDSGATHVYSRYLGAMVAQAQFTADESTQLMKLALQLQAKQPATITITDFAEPALADYPSDAFYTFEQSFGTMTIAGTNRAVESIQVTIANKLDPRFFNGPWLQFLKYCGRKVSGEAKVPYLITTDRSAYEAVTPVANSMVFTNGSHVLTLQMNAKSYFKAVKDDNPLDKMYMQDLNFDCYVDVTAGSDFGITAS